MGGNNQNNNHHQPTNQTERRSQDGNRFQTYNTTVSKAYIQFGRQLVSLSFHSHFLQVQQSRLITDVVSAVAKIGSYLIHTLLIHCLLLFCEGTRQFRIDCTEEINILGINSTISQTYLCILTDTV